MGRAFICLALLFSIAWSGSGISPAAAAPGSDGKGEILFLHYRWRHDSLVLVGKERLRGAMKPLRSDAARRGSGAASMNASGIPGPILSPLGYELVTARGTVLATRFLRDPSIRTVETTENGESVPRKHVRNLDSSDIFLRISGAEAKTIRFYRHGPSVPPAGPLPKRSASGSEPAAAAPAKTLLAEFPLD